MHSNLALISDVVDDMSGVDLPLLFRTIVKIGILYRWEIQYTLLGTENMYVPSPTI